MEALQPIDWHARFVELEAKFIKLEARCEQLEAENARLRVENAQLKAKVQELEEKLNTNSSNSSKPPSQDPFRKTRSSSPTGHKPGGQPGHAGHARKMHPPEEVAKMIEIKPSVCPNCGPDHFEQNPIHVDCRQVIELPEIRAEVTQYNIYTCRCGKCGKHVKGDVPHEAVHGFGPRLMGFLTMLTGEAGVTKRKICAISSHLGIKISLGGLCNIHKLASHILSKPYEEIKAAVLSSSNVNGDESSWRLNHKKCWVWLGATARATFFQIDPSRSQEAFKRVFGGYRNTLTTDRYGGYNCYTGNKQICLAHIARDFQKVSERAHVDGALGRLLCLELKSIFTLWKDFKATRLTRVELQSQAQEHISNLNDILHVGAAAEGVGNKTAALCYDLLNRFADLWRFLYEEAVEPTNNLAERGLRSIVIFRKLSGGSRSDWGERFIEKVFTVACTLRQCALNLFTYLTESFRAYIYGTDPPVLVV